MKFTHQRLLASLGRWGWQTVGSDEVGWMISSPRLALVLASLMAVAGCDSAATVSGNVQYQGQAVESGMVQYVPAEGNSVSTKVDNGSYQIGAERGLKPGVYSVKLYGYRETGRMLNTGEGPSKKEPEVVEMLPRRYNHASEIVVELMSGQNAKDFDLE